MDQLHEWLNGLIKGHGGVIGLFDNTSALHRWLITSPEISSMISKFQTLFLPSSTSNELHHSENDSYRRLFRRQVYAVIDTFRAKGNPFADESDLLYNISTKELVPAERKAILPQLEKIGDKRYSEFVTELLINPGFFLG